MLLALCSFLPEHLLIYLKILLPSEESLHEIEVRDAQIRARRRSSFSQVGGRPFTGARSVTSQAIEDKD